MGHVYIIVAAFFISFSQLLLKFQLNSMGDFPKGLLFVPFIFKLVFTNVWVVLWVLSSIIGNVCWLGALSRFQLSTAFPYFSGLTFVMVAAISFLWFREPVAISKIAGIGIIFLGIMITVK